MGRWAAFVSIAGAVAACRGEPGASSREQAARQAPAAPARKVAGKAAPRTGPSGDRHARAEAHRPHQVKRARGKLARSDDRAIVVTRADGPPLTLRVAPGTSVTLDGRPARAEALPAGADVRAAYRTGDGERPTAITIEAQGPAEPKPAEQAPSSGSGTPSPEPDPGGGG